MKQILLIDDDLHIGNMLEELLLKEDYGVVRAYSGTEALLVLSQSRPDLVLLDLMLPGLSGEEVLTKIQGIPVIVLSAKVDIDHKVEMLLGGAADYVTKPFHTKELLARIAVQLRGGVHTEDGSSGGGSGVGTVTGIGANTGADKLRYEEIVMDIGTHQVTVAGREIKLTRTEFAILKLLLQNPTQVVTKSVILDRISLDTPDCTESSLKMHVSNLRRKLREPADRDYIEAVWGIGFKLRSER